METTTSDEQLTAIPSDYEAFTKFRDTGELPAEVVEDASATDGEEESPSESAEEAGQTAEESETEEEAEQDEDEPQEEDEEPEEKAPVAKAKETRLAKRMRELTGEIKALKLQVAGKTPDADGEGEAEAVSAPETVVETETPAPQLEDFEDTDELSAWKQYEAATRAFNKGETAKAIAAALKEQKQTIETQHAKDSAQADWNKAASRFSDFNEVVSDKCQISAAMESVMRMDPESGTALAYYMGTHPEESLRIAKATLANNAEQWTTALARAGMELGLIRAKLPAGKAVPITKGKAATAPPTPTLKKITSAKPVPTVIRGGSNPRVDPNSDVEARNYEKWRTSRERDLAKQGR